MTTTSAPPPAEIYRPVVHLDRSSPVPLYHQIATVLQAAIVSGELPPHTRIENELAMADRLQVSRPTARRALHELVDKGMLVRKRGVGTEVAPEIIRRAVELTSLHDDLAAVGRTPRTEVLEYETRPASEEVAQRLGISPGDDVVHVRRLRFADGEPLALMTNVIRAELAPSREDLERDGLYASLRARGVRLRLAHQTIGARQATAAEARVLEEPARAAVLTMERIAIADTDTVVELGTHIYRASRYTFQTSLVAR
ncbi:GntR family transcriptional regulator [Georgenia sp. H159]|uniref:GntR family transcriptional regulator n=1 Tax=Georgenia sp. H159 TaxID=3076115 RepID=UPI002D792F61|nr:GntR family transcriptional regulator [Georgenia sp. H159]